MHVASSAQEAQRLRARMGISGAHPGVAVQLARASDPAAWAVPFIMNLSETVDTILDLRSQGAASDERVAEYLKSMLGAANAQVQTQSAAGHSHVLLMVVALALSIVFLVAVVKRRHRLACVTALAIPLILFLELAVGFHVVTWIARKKSDNIYVHFPVQDAARRVVVGTHYVEPTEAASGRFPETVSAFLFPVALVMALLGLWRVAVLFGKLDFEDAHTIALIMGSVCAGYFALALATSAGEALSAKNASDPASNVGSIAVLGGLAEDLAQRYPNLQNTWVTVAFFGRDGMNESGAGKFARWLGRKRNRLEPGYFIGCEHLGNGGTHGYVLDADIESSPLHADRDLVRAANTAAIGITGRQLEIMRGETIGSKEFVKRDYPAIVLSTMPPAERGKNDGGEINRGQLLVSLQLIEATLSILDRPQTVGP